MSSFEIVSKIESLKELEELIEEAKAEAEEIRDSIKAEMTRRDVTEMEAGNFMIRWNEVISRRLDTTAMKKAMPDTYNAFKQDIHHQSPPSSQ